MDVDQITVVVPTKNEASNIATFLQSLPSDVALIVVDNSRDETRRRITALRPENTLIVEHPGNISVARQIGAGQARTEWLLYTDADMVFADDYFDQLQRLAVDPATGGIAGAKLSRMRFRWYYFLFSLWLNGCCAVKLASATGSNMLVKRRALYRAGGFDPALSCNEDSLLMWRISRCGYQVRYEGRLKVFETDHRRLEGGVVRKSVHSLLRCLLLYSGCCRRQMRKGDWGYWRLSKAHLKK